MTEYTIKDFLGIRCATGSSVSPDNKELIFLNNDSGTFQAYKVPINGGKKEQLTFYDEPVQFCFYSPKEDKFVFGKDDSGKEQIQFYLFDLETKKIELLTPNTATRYFGKWSEDGKLISYASNEKNGKDFDIYVMNIETKEIKRVFENSGSCMPEAFSYSGDKLLVIKEHNNFNFDIYLIDLKTNKSEHLTKHEGNARYFGFSWLKNDSGFFLISDQGQDSTGLFFYDLNKRKLMLKLNLEYSIEAYSLSNDQNKILITINEEGYCSLKLYDANNFIELKEDSFPKGLYGNLSRIYSPKWANNDKYLISDFQSSSKQPDIWLLDRELNKITRITESKCGVKEDLFVEPKLIKYESFDGLKIPAFVYNPNKKGKVPAIVEIHGGPEFQSRPGFAPLLQYLLYKGYAVISPNIRGSTGYGKHYQSLDDREKRLDSVKDIEWLHKTITNMENIDINKIALFGGSYGGYMVLICLALQSNLWAAGVDMCGISNFISFLKNTAEYRRSMREAEYGYLNKDEEMLKRFSPINYIENVKAPLFIIHGTNDPRVPLSEAEQIYDGLKKLGRDVHLLVYEDEGHNIMKLKNRLDAYPKIADFLDKHLK